MSSRATTLSLPGERYQRQLRFRFPGLGGGVPVTSNGPPNWSLPYVPRVPLVPHTIGPNRYFQRVPALRVSPARSAVADGGAGRRRAPAPPRRAANLGLTFHLRQWRSQSPSRGHARRRARPGSTCCPSRRPQPNPGVVTGARVRQHCGSLPRWPWPAVLDGVGYQTVRVSDSTGTPRRSQLSIMGGTGLRGCAGTRGRSSSACFPLTSGLRRRKHYERYAHPRRRRTRFRLLTVCALQGDLEPVSGFEPLTVRLQGRFRCCGQLSFCCSRSVGSPSGERSMSLISARFWHATGTPALAALRVTIPGVGLMRGSRWLQAGAVALDTFQPRSS